MVRRTGGDAESTHVENPLSERTKGQSSEVKSPEVLADIFEKHEAFADPAESLRPHASKESFLI